MAEKIVDLVVEKARAGYPALYIVTSEDLRTQKLVKEACKVLDRQLFIWTFGSGKGLLRDGTTTYVAGTEAPPPMLNALVSPDQRTRQAIVPDKSVVILRLFHHFLRDPIIQSQLLDVIPEFKLHQKMLIITTPVLELPPELEKEFALYESPLPSKEELQEVLKGIVETTGLKGDAIPNEEMKKHLVESAMGLTTSEAENAMALAYVRAKRLKLPQRWDPSVVMDEKCQALKKTGLLEYIPTKNITMNSIGGMKLLKSWVSKRKRVFGDEAKAAGIPAPKGILLVGPPGAGKSVGARATAAELGLPLLKCDIGRLFGSLVGESERNVRTAIRVAEAVAPCVWWLDEIEKGLAGTQGGALDGGVGTRMLGTILTWLQEKEAPVFVYATANNVRALPPELLRKGRFDEMFYVSLPNTEERKEIFRIHLAKRGHASLVGKRDIGVDLDTLANDTAGFSGAEIEAAIEEAVISAFHENHALNGLDIAQALANTKPLSTTMMAELKAIETWCKGRVRPANGEESETVEQIARFAAGGRVMEA